MTPGTDRTPEEGDVPLALVLASKEMERRTIVPQVEPAHVHDFGHVGDDPTDRVASRSEAFPGTSERGRGQVEDGDGVAGIQ
jgi:hypothetical protein